MWNTIDGEVYFEIDCISYYKRYYRDEVLSSSFLNEILNFPTNDALANKIQKGYFSFNELVCCLHTNSSLIRHIYNPCFELQLVAVTSSYRGIKYIDHPCLLIQHASLDSSDGESIEFIENPCLEIQLSAIRYNSHLINYIKNPYEEVQYEAINDDVNVIPYIDNMSPMISRYIDSGFDKRVLPMYRDHRCRYCGSLLFGLSSCSCEVSTI